MERKSAKSRNDQNLSLVSTCERLLCNYLRQVEEKADLLAKALKWHRLFAWRANGSLWERIMTRRQSKSVGKLCEATSEQMANKRESSYNKMQKECDKLEIKSHRRWKNKGKNGQRNLQKMLIIICSKYLEWNIAGIGNTKKKLWLFS